MEDNSARYLETKEKFENTVSELQDQKLHARFLEFAISRMKEAASENEEFNAEQVQTLQLSFELACEFLETHLVGA